MAMRGTPGELGTCSQCAALLGGVPESVCESVDVRACECVHVSNLILLLGELPRGRGRDYFAVRNAWVMRRNLS